LLFASPAARLQAQGDSRVTNREHRSINLDPLDRFLLKQMDGTRDWVALIDQLIEGVRSGSLKLDPNAAHRANAAELASTMGLLFHDRVEYLARNGFLIG
jgi:methyltransferase-like protein